MLAEGAGESGAGGQAISQDPAAPWAFLPHQGSQFQNKGILNWVGARSFLSTPYFKGGHDFIVSRAAIRLCQTGRTLRNILPSALGAQLVARA